MTFKMSTDGRLGVPDFQLYAVDVVAKVPVGTIIRAFDDVLGDGEFIYLPGVANVAAGTMVAYSLTPGAPVSVVTTAGLANSGRPIASALVACVAGQFGWFQIGGVANVASADAVNNGKVFLTAAGALVNAAANGVQVLGAIFSSAAGTPAAGRAYVTISRPFVQGQVT